MQLLKCVFSFKKLFLLVFNVQSLFTFGFKRGQWALSTPYTAKMKFMVIELFLI